ncbi:MAG TPA: hypothetical protein DFS52_02750, partial [Myxococcales bacterium]|nr:hypothetical protein [Myxococcales bacterium]
ELQVRVVASRLGERVVETEGNARGPERRGGRGEREEERSEHGHQDAAPMDGRATWKRAT